MQRHIEKLKENYHIIALFLIATLSFFLNFYVISNNGTGNEYYAACIKSMTQSFHNFFFVSFDPAGMVSVDKPPLGLWTQAISVLIFGYHGWAMLLPQALAGTASCLMIYVLTAKYFGRSTGLVSSLIFALTPVTVVVSRNNTMDMQLVFVLLVAAWLMFRSINSGKRRYLFLTAVFVGLGFNIKMLQAYMILPSVVLTYLFFAKEKWGKRFIHGAISVIIMLAVSFAWVFAVELYPSENRPYVDSSSNNSMLELIVGHNGTERLLGRGMGGGGGFGNASPKGQNKDGKDMSVPKRPDAQNQGENDGSNPPQMPGGGDSGQSAANGSDGGRHGFNAEDGQHGPGGQGEGGGQGGSEIGNASAIRLWSSNLYGQSSWLLLFAICSIFGCMKVKLLRKKVMSQSAVVFWSLWLITMAVFFSFAGFYHRYYLCMIAPAIAVLSGIGIITMYRCFKNKQETSKQYLRPAFLLIALLANIALELNCVSGYAALKTWLFPVILSAAAVGILLLIFYLVKRKRVSLFISTAALLVSALAAPFYWALTPVFYVSNTTMPYAGPELAENNNAPGNGKTMTETGKNRSSGLEEYLVKHYKEGSFLVVSQRSNDVAKFIIDTGLPCYAYGGFLGSDNSLTLEKLKQLVANEEITYFLVSSQNGGANSEIISYVKENAVPIDAGEYNSGNAPGGQGGSLYLFE